MCIRDSILDVRQIFEYAALPRKDRCGDHGHGRVFRAADGDRALKAAASFDCVPLFLHIKNSLAEFVHEVKARRRYGMDSMGKSNSCRIEWRNMQRADGEGGALLFLAVYEHVVNNRARAGRLSTVLPRSYPHCPLRFPQSLCFWGCFGVYNFHSFPQRRGTPQRCRRI